MFSAELIKPMLAVDYPSAFDSSDYLFEIKWDGYRCLAYCGTEITLYSRSHRDLTPYFPEITQDLKKVGSSCILDGELIMLGDDHKPNFSQLQRKKPGDIGTYVVFDILHLNGEDLIQEPLVRRREHLSALIEGRSFSTVLMSRGVEQHGVRFFAAVKEQNLEGMVAKDKYSVYLPGKRSRAWRKIKVRLETDAVIIGYIPDHTGFKSLLLAQYDQEQLVYVGNVGTGFSDQDKKILRAGLARISAEQSGLAQDPQVPGALWVKPVLIARVGYLEYTADGRLRQPSFLGLRVDKAVEECAVP